MRITTCRVEYIRGTEAEQNNGRTEILPMPSSLYIYLNYGYIHQEKDIRIYQSDGKEKTQIYDKASWRQYIQRRMYA